MQTGHMGLVNKLNLKKQKLEDNIKMNASKISVREREAVEDFVQWHALVELASLGKDLQRNGRVEGTAAKFSWEETEE